MTGILLIAVGAKNYGQLAGTLAASIRANGCELPIHLVYEEDTKETGLLENAE